ADAVGAAADQERRRLRRGDLAAAQQGELAAALHLGAAERALRQHLQVLDVLHGQERTGERRELLERLGDGADQPLATLAGRRDQLLETLAGGEEALVESEARPADGAHRGLK